MLENGAFVAGEVVAHRLIVLVLMTIRANLEEYFHEHNNRENNHISACYSCT